MCTKMKCYLSVNVKVDLLVNRDKNICVTKHIRKLGDNIIVSEIIHYSMVYHINKFLNFFLSLWPP